MGTASVSASQLSSVDQTTLTRLVNRASGRSGATVIEWTTQSILTGAGEGLGVTRYSGSARDQAKVLHWSLILKALRTPHQGGTTPSDHNYWLREPQAFQSGVLDDLPGGIRAPKCYEVVNQPNGDVWLWLEDITDIDSRQVISTWSLDDYGSVAREFGRFNGVYLVGRPMPVGSWVSHQWFRDYIETSADMVALLDRSLDNPWVKRAYPSAVTESIFRLWCEREVYLRALERLPQTFCHMDVFRRNIILCSRPDADRETVAIDWAFSGHGAVGEELAPLIAGSVVLMEIPASIELEESAYSGYIKGLRDAGWKADERLARLGYAITGAMRYPVGALRNILPLFLDENYLRVIAEQSGKSMAEICDYAAYTFTFFALRLEREARDLMQVLL